MKTCKIMRLTYLIFFFLGTVFGKKKHNRIIGGEPALLGQFPSMVSIQDAIGDHNCGGSIISKHCVLTAAHCFGDIKKRSSYILRTGTNDVIEGGEVYEISQVTIHKGFVSANFTKDIAIITTTKPIQFNQYTRPVKLAPKHFDLPLGTVVSAAGWGAWTYKPTETSPKNLQFIQITVTQCEIADDRKICAGGEKGYDLCHGDSGGPLFYDKLLIGIVSHGKPCATGTPTYFSKIAAFREWIDYQMKTLDPTIYKTKGNLSDA